MEDPLQPETTSQCTGLPAASARSIHADISGTDPEGYRLIGDDQELWICRPMDKSKQICPQDLDNSGELSTDPQYDDDTYLQKGVSFFTNIQSGTPSGGRSHPIAVRESGGRWELVTL